MMKQNWVTRGYLKSMKPFVFIYKSISSTSENCLLGGLHLLADGLQHVLPVQIISELSLGSFLETVCNVDFYAGWTHVDSL